MDTKINLWGSFVVKQVPDGLKKSVEGAEINKKLEYGQVEVIVSNSATDRHGEQIKVNGINTKEVMRNPVLLWGHDYQSVPIGRIDKLWKTNGNLMAKLSFDYDIDDFADKVYKKILRGSINAVSIGGTVDKFNDKDYTVIEKMTMLELSVVPIGAHQDALVTRKTLKDLAEESQKELNEAKKETIHKIVLTV